MTRPALWSACSLLAGLALASGCDAPAGSTIDGGSDVGAGCPTDVVIQFLREWRALVGM